MEAANGGVLFGLFIKKRLQPSCFPEKFAKFVRTPILKNIYERLLLHRECGCDVNDM